MVIVPAGSGGSSTTCFIKNNNFNTYSFGSIHFIYYSIGIHRKLLLKGGTHAIIYSKNFRKDFKTNRILKSIDDLTHFPYNINGWGYNTILAGQIWEKTENSNNWGYASGFHLYCVLQGLLR